MCTSACLDLAHARLARETDELRHARVSKEIGQRVVALRLGLRLTQQQLATKATAPSWPAD